MAGGIDWYRAHHGTVADPKLGLVAAKAKARRGDVIAIWHMLLEAASAAHDRGHPGTPDFEATDFLLGMEEGDARRIYDALVERGLIADTGRISKWEERQPKRERAEDIGATDRKRAQRARDAMADDESGETPDGQPRHATSRHVTPRGEERREEGNPSPDGDGVDGAGAPPPPAPDDCPHQAIIEAFHAALPAARHVREWTPTRAALLRTRWREKRNRQSIEWWAKLFAFCARSAFLTGRSTTGDRRPFELGLDWLLKSENFVRVIEGKYHEPDEIEAPAGEEA